MNIRKGWPLVTLGTLLVVSFLFLCFAVLPKQAMNKCIETPTDEPNSSVTTEFSWGSFDWICHKTVEGTGEKTSRHIPLIPYP
jgi:hypothetical protein